MRRLLDLAPHDHDPTRRRLLDLAEAALRAVLPDAAVAAALEKRPLAGPAVVLGLGKAAVPMGRAALRAAEVRRGVIVTPAPEPIDGLEVQPGAHPVPDASSERGGRRLLELARGVGPDETALVLISGGGSACAVAPAEGLELEDLVRTHGLLLRSGATIEELNVVRKHLSRLKGGRLAEALAGAAGLRTLVLSDVVGSPLDVIASGPTVPDPTTFADALHVLERYGLTTRVPDAVRARLQAGGRGEIAETPEDGPVFQRQTIEIVGSGETAAVAAERAARARGPARIVTTELRGEAREVATDLIERAADLAPGETWILAGETTVSVTGDGKGGRNQEIALAASIALEGRSDLVLCALGTDGIDGMSPAAGAFADGEVVARGRLQGRDAREHLRRNDSHPFMAAAGATIDSGPTGTNVGDLILLHRRARGV